MVVTVDFEPPFSHGPNEGRRVGRRLRELAGRGDVAGLASAVGRKVRAWGSVAAAAPRTLARRISASRSPTCATTWRRR